MLYTKIILVDFMRGQGWLTQKQITAATLINGPEMRKTAQQVPQTFLGSRKGYKLVREATGDEIEDCVRVMLSRAEKIGHRARSLHRLTVERNKIARRLSRVAGQ